MRIALLGYGKMGKEIEKISVERGHKIVYKIDKNSVDSNINEADIAINFSTPETAVQNIKLALKSGVPVVCGTTGWLSDFKMIKELSIKSKISFLYSSNFSLGVNLFLELKIPENVNFVFGFIVRANEKAIAGRQYIAQAVKDQWNKG